MPLLARALALDRPNLCLVRCRVCRLCLVQAVLAIVVLPMRAR